MTNSNAEKLQDNPKEFQSFIHPISGTNKKEFLTKS
tara:strand:- start:193 stop:300 length:108 start_codon:yes stop_codon:yes gene_type:complete